MYLLSSLSPFKQISEKTGFGCREVLEPWLKVYPQRPEVLASYFNTDAVSLGEITDRLVFLARNLSFNPSCLPTPVLLYCEAWIWGG